MAEVVVKDLTPQADGGGGFGCSQEARNRRERVEIVIRHDKGGIAEGLGLPGEIVPGCPGWRRKAHHAELERSLHDRPSASRWDGRCIASEGSAATASASSMTCSSGMARPVAHSVAKTSGPSPSRSAAT